MVSQDTLCGLMCDSDWVIVLHILHKPHTEATYSLFLHFSKLDNVM